MINKRDISIKSKNGKKKKLNLKTEIEAIIKKPKNLSKILLLTTYPPRECGIATYTQYLKNALENKFKHSFDVKICALESNTEQHTYKSKDIDAVLNTNDLQSFSNLVNKINSDPDLEIVMIQHEFGLFKDNEASLINFLKALTKPVIITFHTV